MWIYYRKMCPKNADRMVKSADTDQTAPDSDLGLHCLHRPVCPKIYDHYGYVNVSDFSFLSCIKIPYPSKIHF